MIGPVILQTGHIDKGYFQHRPGLGICCPTGPKGGSRVGLHIIIRRFQQNAKAFAVISAAGIPLAHGFGNIPAVNFVVAADTVFRFRQIIVQQKAVVGRQSIPGKTGITPTAGNLMGFNGRTALVLHIRKKIAVRSEIEICAYNTIGSLNCLRSFAFE